MSLPSQERAWVRELAAQVAAVAHEPRMRAIEQRWRDVNALRRPDRAPVWCRPVGCWSEVLPQTSLRCTEPWLRGLEYEFRQVLFKREVDDDTPVEGHYTVAAWFRVEPANTWGVDVAHHQPGVAGGAWSYDPPLKHEADFDRLRLPAFTLDEQGTHRRHEQVAELLDGIMPVRVIVGVPLGATLGTAAADLRGLESMMMDTLAEPVLLHRLMAFLRDATLTAIDSAEATGRLSLNNVGAMTLSDPIGADGGGGGTTANCGNLWCMANSQEFDAVSPAMWEEFCLNYQKPIFARYGLVGYGCCENLTHKIDGVLSIPNLRIFTCSAWTDLATVLERTAGRCCIMWRQKASDVVFPDDPAPIRAQLWRGAEMLRGRPHQIVLRELQTLAGHPRRLHEWTRLAKEAAEAFA